MFISRILSLVAFSMFAAAAQNCNDEKYSTCCTLNINNGQIDYSCALHSQFDALKCYLPQVPGCCDASADGTVQLSNCSLAVGWLVDIAA
ncbi:hypothetical protein BJ138DRAFT_1167047 [Hygrophoropsis aurantiaca]|uniref:Uncharacterized protein n=1 Tax=Hygrophoropsis aurantiaca TaxID=72124 RepID=A0ACB7ZT90_9AGAM|nr:hypothetical protein BJ138DRAFT_1167047 [Hygrophoropsis aurantiaca]